MKDLTGLIKGLKFKYKSNIDNLNNELYKLEELQKPRQLILNKIKQVTNLMNKIIKLEAKNKGEDVFSYYNNNIQRYDLKGNL